MRLQRLWPKCRLPMRWRLKPRRRRRLKVASRLHVETGRRVGIVRRGASVRRVVSGDRGRRVSRAVVRVAKGVGRGRKASAAKAGGRDRKAGVVMTVAVAAWDGPRVRWRSISRS